MRMRVVNTKMIGHVVELAWAPGISYHEASSSKASISFTGESTHKDCHTGMDKLLFGKDTSHESPSIR